jgi:hypothetical protein
MITADFARSIVNKNIDKTLEEKGIFDKINIAVSSDNPLSEIIVSELSIAETNRLRQIGYTVTYDPYKKSTIKW